VGTPSRACPRASFLNALDKGPVIQHAGRGASMPCFVDP
jgi:hypothetical protein